MMASFWSSFELDRTVLHFRAKSWYFGSNRTKIAVQWYAELLWFLWLLAIELARRFSLFRDRFFMPFEIHARKVVSKITWKVLSYDFLTVKYSKTILPPIRRNSWLWNCVIVQRRWKIVWKFPTTFLSLVRNDPWLLFPEREFLNCNMHSSINK